MNGTVKKLYESDSYIKSFKAIVLECNLNGDYYDVILDQTAFFPEGGGQKGDVGKLDSVNVVDTQIIKEVIIHRTDAPLIVGDEVVGSIDWDIRFSRMQGHSAEHVLSGVAFSRYDCNNVGFHLNDQCFTVDFDKKLSANQIEEIEYAANAAVFRCLTTEVLFPSDEELKSIKYRNKKHIENDIRLVKIGDVDCCACCAPHVSQTGEIGIIKVIDFSPYKSGTRLEVVFGYCAIRSFASLNADVKSIMKLLSAPRDMVVDYVVKKKDEAFQLSAKLAKMQNELAFNKLQVKQVAHVKYAICEGYSFDELKYCSKQILDQENCICILISKVSAGEYIYVISSLEYNVFDITKKINAMLKGKGGGNTQYAQGKISAEQSDIEQFITVITC